MHAAFPQVSVKIKVPLGAALSEPPSCSVPSSRVLGYSFEHGGSDPICHRSRAFEEEGVSPEYLGFVRRVTPVLVQLTQEIQEGRTPNFAMVVTYPLGCSYQSFPNRCEYSKSISASHSSLIIIGRGADRR